MFYVVVLLYIKRLRVSFNFLITVVYIFLIRYQSWEVNGK